MDVEITRMKIKEQLNMMIDQSLLAKSYGWEIWTEGLVIFVRMKPNGKTEPSFLLRLGCDVYPQRAPSAVFVDPVSKQEGAQFWPKGNAFKATNQPPTICIPGTREFYEHIHRERAGEWDPQKRTIGLLVQSIQHEINRHHRR